jgi:hypothetical protein
MKLPLIPQDKANHFIYGFVIYFLSNLLLDHYYCLGVVFIFALGKECYDEYSYNGFDIVDLVYTLIPAVLLNLKYLIQ